MTFAVYEASFLRSVLSPSSSQTPVGAPTLSLSLFPFTCSFSLPFALPNPPLRPPTTLDPWAMRGVSCTQLQPMSNKSTIQHHTITKSMAMAMHIHTNRMAIHTIKPRLLPSPIAQRHQRQQRSPLWSSVFPQCPYRTTNYRLETPRAVSCFYSTLLSNFGLFLHTRLDAFVHTPQGIGRWIIWYGLVVRLAWDVTAQYTSIPHAMWSWSQTRMGGKAARGRQENEEEMGRRLGRMQKTEGTRGE